MAKGLLSFKNSLFFSFGHFTKIQSFSPCLKALIIQIRTTSYALKCFLLRHFQQTLAAFRILLSLLLLFFSVSPLPHLSLWTVGLSILPNFSFCAFEVSPKLVVVFCWKNGKERSNIGNEDRFRVLVVCSWV